MIALQMVLLLVALPFAAADWWAKDRPDHPSAGRVETVAKPVVTVLVIAVAATGGEFTAARLLVVAALVLCLVGDVLLLPALDRFVGGLAAFLVGHLLFVGAFVAIGLPHVGLAISAGIGAVALATTAGGRIVAGAKKSDARLAGPVTAYLMVILVMLVAGWATGERLVMIGVTLFVLSDSLLGWDRFVKPRRDLQVAVMVTYHAAIACLALGV